MNYNLSRPPLGRAELGRAFSVLLFCQLKSPSEVPRDFSFSKNGREELGHPISFIIPTVKIQSKNESLLAFLALYYIILTVH